jgi:hypothetical protein
LVRSDITNLPFWNETLNSIFANLCLKVIRSSEKVAEEAGGSKIKEQKKQSLKQPVMVEP